MLIQTTLLLVFLVLLANILKQRTMARLLKMILSLLILVACYVVAFPAITNRVAALAGVGRGADLIIYLCMASTAYLLTSLYIRSRKLELNTAALVQHLAIETHRLEQLEFTLSHGLRSKGSS
jgi:hypothetical protein